MAVMTIVAVRRLASVAAAPLPPTTGLTVSKETTLITEPLMADGAVDYVRFFNERFGEGVTPENNALVALLPAIGTDWRNLGDQHKAQLGALGGEEATSCFVEWKRIGRGEGDARLKAWELSGEQYRSLPYTPWAPSDSPEFDAWVNQNEACLAVLTKAAERPRFWRPIVSTNNSLHSSNLIVLPLRDREGALRMRAMRSAGTGDASKAWDDLWVAHRLNHLAAQDPLKVYRLISLTCELDIISSDIALLQCSATGPEVVARMLADLRSLPRMPGIGGPQELYDFAAAVQNTSQEFKKKIESLSSAEHRNLARTMGATGLIFPDWDRIARNGNAFNRDVVYGRPDLSSAVEWTHWQREKWNKIKAMLDAAEADLRKGDVNSWGTTADQFFWPRRSETRDSYSDRLMRKMLSITTPQFTESETEFKRLELTPLACAIVLYRLENGVYPTTAELAASRCELPMPQGFWGRPVDYIHTSQGFRLEIWPPGAGNRMEAEKQGMISLEIKRP